MITQQSRHAIVIRLVPTYIQNIMAEIRPSGVFESWLITVYGMIPSPVDSELLIRKYGKRKRPNYVYNNRSYDVAGRGDYRIFIETHFAKIVYLR